MAKRKFMFEDDETPCRRAHGPVEREYTAAQISTGLIGVHRTTHPQASLLGLPRELRDMIYKHIPYEILCPKMGRHHAVDPLVPTYYTNDSPPPPKYAGVAIDDGIVNELVQPAKLRHFPALALVCKQLYAEYLYSFMCPIRNETMRFIVRNYCFREAYATISAFRPNHVIIQLTEDENLPEDISPGLLLWAHFCKTPDGNNMKAAEIHDHKFTLTYQQNLGHDSMESLKKAGDVRENVQHCCVLAQNALFSRFQMVGDRPGWNTVQFLWDHNSAVMAWEDRHNGMAAGFCKYMMSRAVWKVAMAERDERCSDKYGLVDESAILGAKRSRELMEAGGRDDPLDAQFRIMMKRLARLKLD